jgi:hypothetical protein
MSCKLSPVAQMPYFLGMQEWCLDLEPVILPIGVEHPHPCSKPISSASNAWTRLVARDKPEVPPGSQLLCNMSDDVPTRGSSEGEKKEKENRNAWSKAQSAGPCEVTGWGFMVGWLSSSVAVCIPKKLVECG